VLSADEFMGEVLIEGVSLLHPQSANNSVTAELRPLPGQPLGKIRGTLTYKLSSRRIKQRPNLQQRQVSFKFEVFFIKNFFCSNKRTQSYCKANIKRLQMKHLYCAAIYAADAKR
jgi:hypothetical protein